jgi:hypothetical protein
LGPRRVIALLDVSLSHIDARIGPLTVSYEDIVVGALLLAGLGLSLMVLPARARFAGEVMPCASS